MVACLFGKHQQYQNVQNNIFLIISSNLMAQKLKICGERYEFLYFGGINENRSNLFTI